MSYQYLVGSEVDYSEGLEGSRFVVNNPNATTTCGCGASFSINRPPTGNGTSQQSYLQKSAYLSVVSDSAFERIATPSSASRRSTGAIRQTGLTVVR